jgi:uncharacterized protein
VTFLLDVNLLIALVDPQHVAHEAAHSWFDAEGRSDWATCPLTENGLVRIISQPNYTNFLGSAAAALKLLGTLYRLGNHSFWPDSISLLDAALIDPAKLATSSQVTDTYLLALAVANNGRLATLDRRLSPVAVAGGAAALRLIGTTA